MMSSYRHHHRYTFLGPDTWSDTQLSRHFLYVCVYKNLLLHHNHKTDILHHFKEQKNSQMNIYMYIWTRDNWREIEMKERQLGSFCYTFHDIVLIISTHHLELVYMRMYKDKWRECICVTTKYNNNIILFYYMRHILWLDIPIYMQIMCVFIQNNEPLLSSSYYLLFFVIRTNALSHLT